MADAKEKNACKSAIVKHVLELIKPENYNNFSKKSAGLQKKKEYFEKRFGKSIGEWIKKLQGTQSIKIEGLDLYNPANNVLIESVEWIPLGEKNAALKIKVSRQLMKFIFDGKFLLQGCNLKKGEEWSIKNNFGQRLNTLRAALYFGQSKGFLKSFTFQPGNISFRTRREKRVVVLEPRADLLIHVQDNGSKNLMDAQAIWDRLDGIHKDVPKGYTKYFDYEINQFETLKIEGSRKRGTEDKKGNEMSDSDDDL